ncbi:hypothetical protein [Streptomyces sp. N50]|uniref:hypothetical protein n=1 Tax=Streptomyces sp. N50 TaxID=3081765 RepID=UPI00296218A1|nr:hypothetical protein [Streptomyces sp. N50]WOX10597.1 hypothetical protein R2B38_17875 [Streptomyces sp. N50]
MNDLGPPPPTPTAPNPPAPYRAGGLIPPAGAARTWGLTVIGAPLLAVLLLGLVDGSFSTGGGAQAQPWTPPTASYAYTQSATPDPYGASDPAATATATATATETGASVFSEPTQETSTPAADPEAVVNAYFAAVNNRDYATAWALGGKNLGDADYDAFVKGYANTQQDSVSQVSVQGTFVRLVLNALQTDGTSRSYNVTYTVEDGVITHGTATPIG